MKWKTLSPQPGQVFRLEKEFSCVKRIVGAMADQGIKSLKDSRYFLPSLTELLDLCLIEDITAVTGGNTTIQLNVMDITFHG